MKLGLVCVTSATRREVPSAGARMSSTWKHACGVQVEEELRAGAQITMHPINFWDSAHLGFSEKLEGAQIGVASLTCPPIVHHDCAQTFTSKTP